MKKLLSICMFTLCIVLVLELGNTVALAAPYDGQEFDLWQPDGSFITTRIYGDEFYERIESLDGYTLVQDSATGYYSYARYNSDGSDFESTGIVYKNQNIFSRFFNLFRNLPQKGLELSREHIARKVHEQKTFLLGQDYNRADITRSAQSSPGKNRNGVTEIVGITILVDFPDYQSAFSMTDIDDFLNMRGYNGFQNSIGERNNGSIRDYFWDVSGGKVDFTNKVFYYMADNNKAYYSSSDYVAARNLARDAVLWLRDNNQDFIDSLPELTPLANGSMPLSLFYAGIRGTVAHAWSFSAINIDGYRFSSYQMSPQLRQSNNTPSIGVFLHELGHLLFGFPDLYINGSSLHMGYFCLMGYGLWGGGEKNPVPVTAHLRVNVGWADPININNMPDGYVVAAEKNSGVPYKYSTVLSNEYFLVEYIKNEGRYQAFPTEGVIIYHIDENKGYLENPSPRILIVSANPALSWMNSVAYPWGNNNLFSAGTNPSSNLRNGNRSGFHMTNITNEGTFIIVGDVTANLSGFTYNYINASYQYDALNVSATYSFPISIYVELNKRNGFGSIVDSGQQTITLNTEGIGSFTDIPLSLQSFAMDEYLEILIYTNSTPGRTLIRRQVIHPVLFTFN